MGQEWLRGRSSLKLESTLSGRPAPLEKSLQAAARLIVASNAPRVTGLLGLSVEALREAILLAEQVQAVIALDTPFVWNRAGLDAPDLSASWSAAAATADVVLYWGANPDVEYPRHRELYAIPRTADGSLRQVIILDHADIALTLHLAMLLRADPSQLLTSAGDQTQAFQLARVIRAARHVQVYCLGPAAGDSAVRDVWGGIAAHLRPSVKVTVSALGQPGNARGALEVLSWLTGVPGSLYWLGTDDQRASQATWIPNRQVAGRCALPRRADLILDLGPLSLTAQDDFRDKGIPRIVLGDLLDANAEVSIRIPGLDPRLAAAVVRGDGVFLTLCGDATRGEPDPAIDVLRQLRTAVGARAENSPV